VISVQYRNPSNPVAHYDCTAEEILEACGGKCCDLLSYDKSTSWHQQFNTSDLFYAKHPSI